MLDKLKKFLKKTALTTLVAGALTLGAVGSSNAQNYDMNFNVRKLQHGQGPFVSGVKVDIDNGSYIGFTNASGVANIPQIPSGNHTVKVSKQGYIQFTQNNYQLNANTSFDACILPKTQIGPWGTNEFDVAKYKATFTISTGGYGNRDPPQWAQIAPIENRISNANAADSLLVQQAISQLETMSGYDLITIDNYPEESSYTINMNSNTNFSTFGTDEFGTIFVGYSNITTTNQKKRVIHEIVKQFDMNPLSYYIYPSVMDPDVGTMTELQPWDANHIAVTFDEHYAKQRGEQDLFIGNMEEFTNPTTPNPTVITLPVNNATNLGTAVNTIWNNISGTDKYHVDIATNATFTNMVYDLYVLRKDTTINLSENTTYFERVRTENTAGVSSWSPTVTFTTVNTAVGGTSITLPLNGAINVTSPTLYNWNVATNSLQYNLEVSLDNTFATLVQDVIVPNTSTTLPLNGHRTFFNRVRGENGSNVGPWSVTTTFSTLNHPPSAPTNLTPTASNPQDATGQILINWDPATDIDNDPIINSLHIYNPQLDTTFNNITPSEYTLAANVLEPGSQYSYTVTASDGDLSTTSMVQTLNTLALVIGNNALTQPTNGATNVSTTPTYVWTPASNANKYNLEVALNNTFTNLVHDVTVYSLDTVLTLNGHREYFNRIRGENGNSFGQWSTTTTFSTINTAPTAATNLTPTPTDLQNATQPIIFNWTASTDIDNDPIAYTLHIFNGQLNQTYPNITTNNYTLAANILQPSSQYTYNITANDGELSTLSLDQILNTVAGTIGNTTITQPTNGATNVSTTPTYTWTPANNANRYNLEVSLNNTFTNLVHDVTVYGLDTVLTLNGNREYFNRVRGETPTDAGSWSGTVAFQTHNNLPQIPVIDSPQEGLLSAANYENGQLIIKYTSTAFDIDNDPITTTVNVSGPGVNETFITSQNGQVIKGIDSTLFHPDTEYLATINATDNTEIVNGDNVLFQTLYDGITDIITNTIDSKLYPNPCKDFINIKTNATKPVTLDIEIYDMTGRLQEDLHENIYGSNNYENIRLDVSQLKPGMYIYNIHAKTNDGKDMQTETGKIIKQ